MHFDPVKYVVPDYIVEGCTLLAGRPKLGKSWLCLEIGIAVASGGDCLGGIQCEQGDVLYLALEDNRRRLKWRIKKVLDFGASPPERLQIATEWPRAGAGGIRAIAQWIEAHPGARLVLVDVLAMFRPITGGRDQQLYERDYHALKGLQQLASQTGVAIVVVHHTRKSQSETDPFEKVSGTLGLSGAADSTLILDRDSQGATIYGRGRDIQEIETAVHFDRNVCRWSALGKAADIRRTSEREAILDCLADNQTDNRSDNPDGMTPAEIADATGMKRNNVKQLLYKMVKAGEVEKAQKPGRYLHPGPTGYQEEADPR